MDPDQLTLRLGLTRLEREGGWCRELGVRRDGSSSSILYMMRTSDTTAWHRLTGINEFWCHHQGANIRLEEISDTGCHTTTVLGRAGTRAVPQHCVEGNTWFKAHLMVEEGSDTFSLVSCICVPPFSWDLFTSASEAQMVQLFPHLAENINSSKN